MKNFVSQEWLLNNLSKDNLVILDARGGLNDPEYGFKEYQKYHIKGAQFVSLKKTMTGKLGTYGGRHPLPDMEDFAEAMKKLGIKDNSIITIYDDGDYAMAGRLWWLLKYFGKDNVFILEQGMKGWLNSGLKVTEEIIKPKESDSLSLNIDKSMVVDMDYVKAATSSDKIAIVDSRAYERYSGQEEPLDKIPGHIPNALNFPWMNLVAGGKMMSMEELKDYFEPLKRYDEIIVYCGSGITGTVNVLFMDEIGLSPKLYLGGYSDWISYDDNVVIKEK